MTRHQSASTHLAYQVGDRALLLLQLAGNLGERLAVGVVHDHGNQALLQRDRVADVDAFMHHDLVAR